MTKKMIVFSSAIAVAALLASVSVASAQTTVPQTSPKPAPKTPPPPPAPAPNYVIGPDDVLVVNVWNEPKISGPVIVRPDGKITLPVGNDIVASGLTTEELKAKISDELKKGGYFEQPDVIVQVQQINSRKVFITGLVNKPGPYPLSGPMTVLQLITTAGGLQEFADKKNLMLVSGTLKDNKTGQPLSYRINYDDLSKGKNLAKYNIELRPGDTLIVR